jgi:hypothetical protein
VFTYRNERLARDSKALTADPLPYIRIQTLSLIFTLLKDRPEQEQNLLRLLVWKLVCVSNHNLSRQFSLFLFRATHKSQSVHEPLTFSFLSYKHIRQ